MTTCGGIYLYQENYEMFIVWMLVMITAVLANSQVPLNTICQQMNETGDQEHFISKGWVDVDSDCLQWGNMTAINSTFSGLDEFNQNSSNETDQMSLATPTPIPAWRVTWMKFKAPLYGVYIPIVAGLGFIGNALTLSVLRKDVLRSSSTVYLLGITISDMIFTINYFPIVIQVYDSIYTTRIMRSINAFRYCYCTPMMYISYSAAIWIIVCFTIERLVAVKWPLKAKELCTKRRARIAVIGAYVLSLAIHGIRFSFHYPVRNFDSVTQEVYFTYATTYVGSSKTVSAVVFLLYLILVEAIPFVILTCANAAIIWGVWGAQRRRLTMSGNTDSKGNKEGRITHLLIAMVIAHLVCNACEGLGSIWLATYGRMAILTIAHPYPYYVFTLSTALVLTNPLVNCILYVVCSSAMREGLKSQLCLRRTDRPI